VDLLYSILSFVVAIGVLVTVHEFGHFWVARRLGVKVLRFSVGFGRPLWSWRSGPDDIEYVIAAVPLGGYVKMLDEREGDVDPADQPRAFNRQPLWVRFAVVLAGPLFNFLFAVVAYWLMFVIGVSGLRPLVGEVTPGSLAERAGLTSGQEIVQVDTRTTRTWEAVIQAVISRVLEGGAAHLKVSEPGKGTQDLTLDTQQVVVDELTRGQFFTTLGIEPRRPRIPPVIGRLEGGGAAELAGIKIGDQILSADGGKVEDWRSWVDLVRARPGQPMQVTIARGEQRIELELRPAAVTEGGARFGRIGAAVAFPEAAVSAYYVTERHGPLDSLGRAVAKTYDISSLTLRMLWKMLMLEVSVENLSGPISIAQYAGYSAQVGVSRFLEFLGIVSVSLGLLNLLPIPVLDGGHLMYYLIELFKGRPVSEEAQVVGQRLGIAMLFGLMGLAFYNDLARLFG